jgi:hypothetical protein
VHLYALCAPSLRIQHHAPTHTRTHTCTSTSTSTHTHTHLDGIIQLFPCGHPGHGHDGPQATFMTQDNVCVQAVTLCVCVCVCVCSCVCVCLIVCVNVYMRMCVRARAPYEPGKLQGTQHAHHHGSAKEVKVCTWPSGSRTILKDNPSFQICVLLLATLPSPEFVRHTRDLKICPVHAAYSPPWPCERGPGCTWPSGRGTARHHPCQQ